MTLIGEAASVLNKVQPDYYITFTFCIGLIVMFIMFAFMMKTYMDKSEKHLGDLINNFRQREGEMQNEIARLRQLTEFLTNRLDAANQSVQELQRRVFAPKT